MTLRKSGGKRTGRTMIDPWSRPRQFQPCQFLVYIPHLPIRLHLIERVRLSAGGTPGVALISAPAGFGKTTLVSE